MPHKSPDIFEDLTDFHAEDIDCISKALKLDEKRVKALKDTQQVIDKGARCANELAQIYPERTAEIYATHRKNSIRFLEELAVKGSPIKILAFCRECHRFHFSGQDCCFCEDLSEL